MVTSRRPDLAATTDDLRVDAAGSPAARLIRNGVVLVLGGLLAWVAVSVQLAARAAQGGLAAQALVLNPHSTYAAARLADAALVAGRPVDAARYAAEVVRRAPLSPAGVRTLGIAAGARGDDAGASRWMGLAGALGWRDLPTQLWLADRLTNARRYGDALPRIEAILRQPGDPRPTHALLNALAQRPDARAVIARRLADRPTWSMRFLADEAALAPADLAGREALLANLRRTATPAASRAEAQPYVARLITAGEDAHAHAFWLATFADRRGVDPAGIYDGGFDAATDGAPFPFEWSIPDDATTSVTVESDGPGKSLHITAAEALPAVLIGQEVLLAPGNYVLNARLSGSGADAVHWQLTCRGGAPIALATRGGVDAAVAARFTIPPQGCGAQRLELRSGQLSGAAAVDLRIDDVAVKRSGAG